MGVVSGLFPEHHEMVRLGEWQRPKECGIYNTEDCGESADAQRKECGGEQRESRSTQQEPRAIANVLNESVHGV